MWIVAVVASSVLYNVYHGQSHFFSFGPSEHMELFNVKIHTWWRYTGVMTFLVCTQALKVFADETVSPFILNEVMQSSQQTTLIDNFSYIELQFMCQSYYTFSGISKLLTVFVSLTRVDLVLAIICTDVGISIYTTDHFLTLRGFVKGFSGHTSTENTFHATFVAEGYQIV